MAKERFNYAKRLKKIKRRWKLVRKNGAGSLSPKDINWLIKHCYAPEFPDIWNLDAALSRWLLPRLKWHLEHIYIENASDKEFYKETERIIFGLDLIANFKVRWMMDDPNTEAAKTALKLLSERLHCYWY